MVDSEEKKQTRKRGAENPLKPRKRRPLVPKAPATVVKVVRKKIKKKTDLALARSPKNPIIEPAGEHWESKATFNPSAVYGDGKVHLIYRAIGETDVSVFGYASSKDGFHFDTRSSLPAFFHRSSSRNTDAPRLDYISGGGWNGGSEDPRLTKIHERVYMLYTSFDGWGAIRLALTSISFADFARQQWKWKTPVFISPPGEVHKNWVLFPEKIGGKFAILHSISPQVAIEYVDSLDEFDGTKFIHSKGPDGSGNKDSWDSWVRGVGPAPIKTEKGWLVLYHAMDVSDPNKYKLGVMLLDLEDPTKILVRARQPILEPEEEYENNGHKWGVVYACGAVVVNGWLFVYYGGADRVTCVATAKLDAFLEELQGSGKPGKMLRKRK